MDDIEVMEKEKKVKKLIKTLAKKYKVDIDISTERHGIKFAFHEDTDEEVMEAFYAEFYKKLEKISDNIRINSPRRYHSILVDIIEYTKLAPGWDGPGSVPMDEDILVFFCFNLFDWLEECDPVLEVESELGSDGELYLDFKFDDKTLELKVQFTKGDTQEIDFDVTADARTKKETIASGITVKDVNDLTENWFGWLFSSESVYVRRV